MTSRRERMNYIHEIAQQYPRPSVKGYLYIIISSTFPEYCKVGKSIDVASRLNQYNSYNPYNTFIFYFISNLFEDYTEAENEVLESLRQQNIYPKHGSEWFDISHKDLIKDLITKGMSRCSLDDCVKTHKRLLTKF
jgi:hypothetical protein